MSNTPVVATVNLGNYTSIDDDFFNSVVVDKSGNQLFLKTLDNYINLLKDAVSSLELIRDSTDDDEASEVELLAARNVLRVTGNPEIIERYVGCGMATYDDLDDDELNEPEEDDDTDTDETENTEAESSTESSDEYYEYLVASDNDDTPIELSDDIEDANLKIHLMESMGYNKNNEQSSDSEDEVLIKKKTKK